MFFLIFLVFNIMRLKKKLIKAKVYMLAGSRCLIYYYALEKVLSKSELKG